MVACTLFPLFIEESETDIHNSCLQIDVDTKHLPFLTPGIIQS